MSSIPAKRPDSGRPRKTIWGYAPDEALSSDELIRKKYRGIRPAPGYPACPDHSQKPELFRLNAGQNAGLTLTESFAMIPISAVSGYYLAHPPAEYFGVTHIGKARSKTTPGVAASRSRRPRSTCARTLATESHIPPHSYGEVSPSYGDGGVRAPECAVANNPSVGVRRRHLTI
jgi:hypothetical protein